MFHLEIQINCISIQHPTFGQYSNKHFIYLCRKKRINGAGRGRRGAMNKKEGSVKSTEGLDSFLFSFSGKNQRFPKNTKSIIVFCQNSTGNPIRDQGTCQNCSARGFRPSCWGFRPSCWGFRWSCWGFRRSCWGFLRSCWGCRRSRWGCPRSSWGCRRSNWGIRQCSWRFRGSFRAFLQTDNRIRFRCRRVMRF